MSGLSPANAAFGNFTKMLSDHGELFKTRVALEAMNHGIITPNVCEPLKAALEGDNHQFTDKSTLSFSRSLKALGASYAP